MDPAELQRLARSMEKDGQQRPIKVRPHPEIEGAFEVVFGHRTVSALNMAGMETAQALVEDLRDDEVMWAQYVENELREEVSDYDRARWLKRMIEVFGYTQSGLGKKMGKTQGWVAQHLRMLELEGIITRVIIEQMSEFQARAILSAPEELLPAVSGEVEAYYNANGVLPSASAIADIIEYVSATLILERTEVLGEMMEPLGASAGEKPEEVQAPSKKEGSREDVLLLESPQDIPLSGKTLTAEEYIKDYYDRYSQPDIEFLSWLVSRDFRMSQDEARKLIDDEVKGRKAEESSIEEKELIKRYEKEEKRTGTRLAVETSTCPLCGSRVSAADLESAIQELVFNNPDIADRFRQVLR